MARHVFTELLELALENYGYLTPDQLRDAGIDPKRLVDLQQRDQAERIAQGLYRLNVVPHTRFDQYMEAALLPAQHGVLSHETALELHEVSDVNPDKIHITVPRAYRPKREFPSTIVVHREDLEPEDVTVVEGLPIVTLKTAIIQGEREHLGRYLLKQALEEGAQLGKLRRRDLPELRELLGLEAGPVTG